MTFLNATLMFGMAAAAVPVVLHLIARREPRKVVFPSVRFLVKRFESNRSRLKIRRWWLLALRIVALAALALALARPAIHQSLSITWLTIGLVLAAGVALLVMASVSRIREQSRATSYALLGGAIATSLIALGWGAFTYASGPLPVTDRIEPVSIAIVLDNSPTSAWRTPDDDRIGRMKDLATWMVTRLPRTSRIAVVDRSAQVATFSLDVASAISKIEQLRPLEVTQPIAARIEAATRLVRTSDLPNRQVLLVTDLAVSTWQDAMAEAGLSALLGQDPPVALTVFDLGEFSGMNRSLSIPQFADATPPRGVPVPISTTLQLDKSGDASPVSVTAELEMYRNDPALPVVRDGVVKRPETTSVDRTSVRVAAGGSSELLLTIPSLEIGIHHGRVRLVAEDALPLDDTRYFSLQVLTPSRVLLVGENTEEAEIISRAITASPGLIDPANAEFAVERVAFADLSVVRLADFDALILLDPPRQALQDDQLMTFARGGGGVLVCLGPAAGNDPLDSALVPQLVRNWRAPPPGTFMQVVAPAHPVTEPLSTDTPWSDFRIRQYWQLDASNTDTVLMRYAGTAHPALVERTVRSNEPGGDTDDSSLRDASDRTGGPGRVLVLSTPLPALARSTRSWNDLFGTDPWPAWLLLRQSVEYLTRRGGADWMSPVGQPRVIPLESAVAEQEESDRPRRIQLFPPGDGAPVPLDVSPDSRRVTISEVSRSGTYWLRGAAVGAGFSANLPPSAIALDRIEPPALDQIFAADQYSLVTDREGIEFAENKATQRVSLHSPAILLVLVVFLLEQILGNRFYRSSS